MIAKEDLCEVYGCSEEAIILEPHEVFGKGIIGFTEGADGGNILVYGYNKLVEALAQSYMDAGDVSPNDPEDAEQMAIDWLEYNTMRSLPYMDMGFRPIIVTEVDE